MHSGG